MPSTSLASLKNNLHENITAKTIPKNIRNYNLVNLNSTLIKKDYVSTFGDKLIKSLGMHC